jgi:N6-L-threonylcarbamoyladenine synthase
MNRKLNVLSIETSCDETAIALVEVDISDSKIAAHEIKSELFSQIDIHKEFGGVFPAIAKREHARYAPLLLERILEKREVHDDHADEQTWNEIETLLEREPDLFEKTKQVLLTHTRPKVDLIAVTQGPGLEPALWVGINFARALSLYWNIPLVGTNHMKGHIFSVLLNRHDIVFPALALLVSGGHTELVEMNSVTDFTVIGKTKDDAVGESYDKVARMMGLEYPGGPKVAQLAQTARDTNMLSGDIKLPRPMISSKDLDFSFSGLKTAALYKIRELGTLDDTLMMNIAHEFEEAVTDVVLTKVARAVELKHYKTLIVSGGVMANTYLRTRLEHLAQGLGIPLLLPKLVDSTDNAQMIAVAGAIESLKEIPKINPELRADGNLLY